MSLWRWLPMPWTIRTPWVAAAGARGASAAAAVAVAAIGAVASVGTTGDVVAALALMVRSFLLPRACSVAE
jgi:hypothetical protein